MNLPAKREWFRVCVKDDIIAPLGFVTRYGWVDEDFEFFFQEGYIAVSCGRMYFDYIDISKIFKKRGEK
jgi:hypothetical protein